MTGSILAIVLVQALAAAPGATATRASANPRAIEAFDRDWVLMDWALRFHDRDRDAQLSISEAQSAADAFKSMADANGDGRVTPTEYRSAREFIVARY